MKDKQENEVELLKNIIRYMALGLIAMAVLTFLFAGLLLAILYVQAVREIPRDLKNCHQVEKVFRCEN